MNRDNIICEEPSNSHAMMPPMIPMNLNTRNKTSCLNFTKHFLTKLKVTTSKPEAVPKPLVTEALQDAFCHLVRAAATGA